MRRAPTRWATAACCLMMLVAAVTTLNTVRADFYDLAEDQLIYDYPSIRRVIAMYNLEDSPSLLGSAKETPFIQLDLKFTTYTIGELPAADTKEDEKADTKTDTKKDENAKSTDKEKKAAAPAKGQSLPSRFRVQSSLAKETSVAVTKDEASAEMEKAAKENADAPQKAGGTSSETVTPKQAAEETAKEAAAAAAGVVPVAPNTKPRTPKHSANPQVQVLIMQDTTLDSIGHWDLTENRLVDYCCTSELFAAGVAGCDEIGSLIVKGDRVHKLMSAAFLNGEKHARLDGPDARYEITTTGEHILIISNCDPRLAQVEMKVTGGGVWKNPFGYLPGRLYGFLPFYFTMFVVYLFLTCAWGALNFLHRKEVAGIQHCISTALVLTLIEVLAWFIDYYNFNSSGVRHMGGVIAAILITVLRLTVSRMLVVSVSIGYPVVRPNLSLASKIKIGILGLVYFICEAALEVVTRYAQTNATAEKWRIFLSIPVAVLNAIFYWWIFTALHDLINYLEQQNQAIKLAMYRTFTHVLAASLVAAVAFALYQIYFMATNQLALHWSLLWLLDGGFQLILYTVIFASISWLWRPSSDSRRYAYAELSNAGGLDSAGGMDDDDEFGEIELGETEDGHSHAAINADNAKFTVEEDEEQM